jgi:hypothetical protein
MFFQVIGDSSKKHLYQCLARGLRRLLSLGVEKRKEPSKMAGHWTSRDKSSIAELLL